MNDTRTVEVTCRFHGAAQMPVDLLDLVRGGLVDHDSINQMPWQLRIWCFGLEGDPCVNNVGFPGEVASLIADGVKVVTPSGMFKPCPSPEPRRIATVAAQPEPGPLRFEPDPAADGISTTAYVATLPRRRWSYEAKGRPLFMPRTGMVMTPYEMDGHGGWYCAVTVGTDAYPTDGYSLAVGKDEIETAIDLTGLLTAGLGSISQERLDDEAAEHAAARERAAASPFARVIDRIGGAR